MADEHTGATSTGHKKPGSIGDLIEKHPVPALAVAIGGGLVILYMLSGGAGGKKGNDSYSASTTSTPGGLIPIDNGDLMTRQDFEDALAKWEAQFQQDWQNQNFHPPVPPQPVEPGGGGLLPGEGGPPHPGPIPPHGQPGGEPGGQPGPQPPGGPDPKLGLPNWWPFGGPDPNPNNPNRH